MRESKLYSSLQNFLKRNGYVVRRDKNDSKGFVNIKVGEYHPDVVGIKNIGDEFSREIEIVAVEVKKSTKNISNKDWGEAGNYKTFAHKSYLAAVGEFSEEDIEKAKGLGLGLIELRNKKSSPKIRLEATKNNNPVRMFKALGSLRIYQCSICKRYIFRDSDKIRSKSGSRAQIIDIFNWYCYVDDFLGVSDKVWHICLDCVGGIINIIDEYSSKDCVDHIDLTFFYAYNKFMRDKFNKLVANTKKVKDLEKQINKLQNKIEKV